MTTWIDELERKRREKSRRKEQEEAALRAKMSPLNRAISDGITGAATICAAVGAVYLFFSGTRHM